MSSAAGYDRLAPYYDQLGQLIYGKAIASAQHAQIEHLPIGARVLIVGGGTGKVLEHLVQQKPQEVIYVDISKAMISEAR